MAAELLALALLGTALSLTLPPPTPADLLQVEITRAYLAKQADEISLQQADVVLVLEQEDGERHGWARVLAGCRWGGPQNESPRQGLEDTRCRQLTLHLARRKRFLHLLMGGLIQGPSVPSLKDLFKRS